MTCIVAVKYKNTIVMGADSAGVSGLSLELRKDPKVFIRGGMIFGFTSSFRMGQLLMTSFTVPPKKKGISDYNYMCTSFTDALRDCFNKGGFKKNINGEDIGGTFIVGYKGKIYKIEDDFQVAIPHESFTACGCGQDIALGSLYTSKGQDPMVRVNKALRASQAFSAGVRAPFKILELSKGGQK